MSKCRTYAFLLISAITVCALLGCSSTQTSTGVTASANQKCQFQVAASSSSFPENGGTGTLSIDTTRDCTWSVSSNANWVSLADAAGQGGASVPYTVAANTVPQTRVANLNIEGQA